MPRPWQVAWNLVLMAVWGIGLHCPVGWGIPDASQLDSALSRPLLPCPERGGGPVRGPLRLHLRLPGTVLASGVINTQEEEGRRALSNERRLSLSNCECLFLAQGQSSMLMKRFLGPTKEMHWSVPKMKFCFPVKTKWWLYCVLQVQNTQSGVTDECPQAFLFQQDIYRS